MSLEPRAGEVVLSAIARFTGRVYAVRSDIERLILSHDQIDV